MSNETMLAADNTDDALASATDAELPATAAGDAGNPPPADTAQAKPAGAPESYEFQAPEGVQFDDAVIGAFAEVAKELDLPQDRAQIVLDRMAPLLQSRQVERIEAARAEWKASSEADKEFGGEQLAENLGTAKKALDAFATPELRGLLNESGLGNHPEVIRLFYRVGKATSEDSKVVTGQGGQDNRNDARRLYAASNMNP